MSKKKNVVEEVRLSNQELIPSVIGVIDNKEKSNWSLIILFVFLIVFIVFLPTVTAYLNGEYQVENKENNKPGSNQPNTPPIEDEIVFYAFSEGLNVLVDGVSFSDFSIANQMISFAVTNNAETSDYLNTHHLYLELYDANQMFLQRIKLTSDVIGKGSKELYEYELTATESLIQQFTITEKTEHDYPNVNLKKIDEDLFSLTCTKGKERLIYEFDKNYKLLSIEDTINYTTGDTNYQEVLTDYRQITSKYNALQGVTSNIVEVGTGFTVTTTLDLENVDYANRIVKNTLDNPGYYPKDTLGKVVHFELSSMNYRCN